MSTEIRSQVARSFRAHSVVLTPKPVGTFLVVRPAVLLSQCLARPGKDRHQGGAVHRVLSVLAPSFVIGDLLLAVNQLFARSPHSGHAMNSSAIRRPRRWVIAGHAQRQRNGGHSGIASGGRPPAGVSRRTPHGGVADKTMIYKRNPDRDGDHIARPLLRLLSFVIVDSDKRGCHVQRRIQYLYLDRHQIGASGAELP
jgi:hypothetical protein